MKLHEIIKYPILTEKTNIQMEEQVYTFAVDKRAHKTEIKKAIEFIFDVKVLKLNVINIRKKPAKLGKYAGFKTGYKKAMATLSEGSINFFPEEGITKSDVNDKAIEEDKKAKKLINEEKAKRAAEKINKK